MKKLCLSLALLLAAIPAFSACGWQAPFDPDALTVMGKESDLAKPYMTKIFDLYKETTGENLNIVSVKDPQFEEEALSRLGKENAPDILLHFHNADLNRFDVENNFVMLNGAEWVDDLTESAKKYCTDADGNLLGLPFWESSVSGCYYNKTLLAGYGIPETQADFDFICDTLLDTKGITPICWPGNCSWMLQFGLDPIFADGDGPALLERLNAGEIAFADIPEVENMVTWLSGAANKGWFGDNYLDLGWDDISGVLAEGKAAMVFIWDTWFYTDFKPGTYDRDDFALMPVFMGTATDGGTYEGGNLNMMMVAKNSEKKDRALAFLDFCAEPAHYNYAFEGIPTVQVFLQQTEHVQSQMVTDAQASIAKYERVSTASTKIVGYSADDLIKIVDDLMRKKITIAECIAKMDESRLSKARAGGFIA